MPGAKSRFEQVYFNFEESSANADLSDDIQLALRTYRKLIVICSLVAVASG